jgi:beta-glucosidase
LRPFFIAEHLQRVAMLIAEGIDIRGYYHWSLLDNFEWIKGYGPRFGLVHVDYETFERKPTRSAALFSEIISQHRGKGRSEPRSDTITQCINGVKVSHSGTQSP